MSTFQESQVLEKLKAVKYPGFSRDIVSFGLVKNIRIEADSLLVQMSLATADLKVPQQIKADAEAVLKDLAGAGVSVSVRIDVQAPAQPVTPSAAGIANTSAIEGVKYVLAVASGKGGVGKSTVAANLAVALEKSGARVGLCDCDLYGPSVGLMFGTQERPFADSQTGRIQAVERYGLRLMSMGFLLEDGAPAVLRGPMVTKYTQQFLRQVDWGDLDYLVLDLPPGTGDIQLTIVQTVALAGTVIVTTPQEMALIDARKAVGMFKKVNVPILGLIENMSYFLCPSDGKRYDIFGTDGGRVEAERLGVPLLAQIPIDIPTRECGDRGMPVTAAEPEGAVASVFLEVAKTLRQTLEK
jgi:ATP-binding protein involved in chromosome partitioning